MTRFLGAMLIITGLALAMPQVFVALPDQRVFLAGLVVAFIGALILTDHPRTERGHGHD